jgi:succinylglutamate desuccinylase
MWLLLVGVGSIDEGDVPELEVQRRTLADAAAGLPRAVAMRHRHLVRPGDRFEMAPGFANFQPVSSGQVVGRDRYGAITVPEDGRMLLPLYQGQGEDGFFIVSDVPSESS